MTWESRTPIPLPGAFKAWEQWANALVVFLRRSPPAGAPGLISWPIGSVFHTNSNTNPADLLGGGNWTAVAAGPPVWSWQRTA